MSQTISNRTIVFFVVAVMLLTWMVPPIANVVAQPETTVDIKPETLNLKSKGKWVTAFIELSEGYDVADINVTSILMNYTIPANLKHIAIGDYDNDTVLDLMVKFERQEVMDFIIANYEFTSKFGTVTLTITGKLNNGTQFQGSDMVRIIRPKT